MIKYGYNIALTKERVEMVKKTPRDEIVEILEAYIEENQLKEHDKLPSERFLCEKWEINRTTLRGALTRLIREGQIYSVSGKGYFVAEKKLVRNLQDLRPLYDSAKEQGKDINTVVLSCQVVNSDENIAKNLAMTPGQKAVEIIRLRYINDVPSLIEYSYMNHSLVNGLEAYDFNTNSLYNILQKNYHIKPVAGSQKVSISYATKNESLLLQIQEGTPIFFLRGVTFNEGTKAPFEYFKSIVRSDNVKFFSTMRRKEE